MRFTIITASIALVLALAICFACQWTINRAIYEMQDISMQAIDDAQARNDEACLVQMVALANTWERYKPWLEMMTSHEDVHNVTEHYTEAEMNLERAHYDDYHKSMVLLDEALKHIRDQEAMTLANIF